MTLILLEILKCCVDLMYMYVSFLPPYQHGARLTTYGRKGYSCEIPDSTQHIQEKRTQMFVAPDNKLGLEYH